MDLRNGKVYWTDTLDDVSYPPLEANIECDVCIVGSGSSGAHCAYFLADTGLKVVLVDKRTISAGSTAANTGLLQYSNDKSLTSLIHTFGETAAVRHLKLGLEALNTLKNTVIPSLSENPDFISRKSLYYASTEIDVAMLEEEYRTLKKHGFPVEYVTQAEIEANFSFSKPAALVTSGDAEINPYKHAHLLLKYAYEKGVKIYADTSINGKILKEDGACLFTDNGHSITTKNVIFATGYEAQEEVNERNAHINSSYAITTNRLDELPKWHEEMMLWETERPYLYTRTTVDKRIIIGGLDEGGTSLEQRNSRLLHKRDLLLQSLIELFPELAGKVEAEYYWGANFGETHDGLPTIGRYDGYPNCHFVLGYGGNGTVSSIVLAQILRDVITKGEHPDLDLYLPGRPGVFVKKA